MRPASEWLKAKGNRLKVDDAAEQPPLPGAAEALSGAKGREGIERDET